MRYLVILSLIGCLALSGCSEEKTPPVVKDTGNAVEKAYDKTTGALREVAEGVNDAVYK